MTSPVRKIPLNPLQARVKGRLEELGRNPFEAARIGELERSFVYDIINGTKASVQTRSLAKVAKALDWTVADLMGEVVPASIQVLDEKPIVLPKPGQEFRPPPVAGNRDVPVRGVAVGGDDADFSFNGDVSGYIARPRGLEGRPGIFAVWMVNDSLYPAYKPGDPLYVDPDRPPAIGDDVVVELHADPETGEPGQAYAKRLVRRSASQVIVEQFNPAKELVFPTKSIKRLYRIVPLVELVGL